MKKLYTFFILIFSVFIGKAQNPDDIVYIPDANFKARLLNPNNSSSGITASNYNFTYNNTPYADIDYTYCDVDINGDGEIQYSEAQLITFLNLDNRNISSLEGIEAFTNLKSLSCNENLLTNLNVTSLSNLIYLNCGGNQFTAE